MDLHAHNKLDPLGDPEVDDIENLKLPDSGDLTFTENAVIPVGNGPSAVVSGDCRSTTVIVAARTVAISAAETAITSERMAAS